MHTDAGKKFGKTRIKTNEPEKRLIYT